MEQEMHFDIDHVAKLARLELTPEQHVRFAAEMEAIAAMAEDLPDVQRSGAAVFISGAALRPDHPEVCDIPQEAFFRNAPELCCECFAVPQTVEVEV